MRVTAPCLLAAVLLGVVSCGGSPAVQPASGRRVRVVAAENFWGDVARQLGGPGASVTSIERDPNADPHQYEASATTARQVADADYVIINGAGYDAWADKLLSGNPRTKRRILRVSDLVAKQEGDNPHLWYSPTFVAAAADRMTRDFMKLDGGREASYAARRTAFDVSLQPVRARIAQIKAARSGVQVGATESIFVYLADALGLDLTTPPALMTAVAEGNDPPAAAVTEFEDQIVHRRIKVLVYNQQTPTPVTVNLRKLATRAGVPTVGVTETLPGTTRFQAWQQGQLDAIAHALDLP